MKSKIKNQKASQSHVVFYCSDCGLMHLPEEYICQRCGGSSSTAKPLRQSDERLVKPQKFNRFGGDLPRSLFPTSMADCSSCPFIAEAKNSGENTEKNSEIQNHTAEEAIKKLALFMVDDWKACSVLLLYIALPNAPIRKLTSKISLGTASICNARQRAEERFPELSGVLGLKTPHAVAQQKRWEEKKQEGGGK